MAATLLVMLTCVACSGNRRSSGTTVSDRARDYYHAGMDELVSGNYTEAIQAFQVVLRAPGYVKYTSMARLRIADALFLQEKYDPAIENYRAFLKQYEGDVNAGYARYRIGHAYHAQVPSDWFLAPPSHERQQTFVRLAERELNRFVSLYPTHRLVADAQELLDDCQRKLYAHELYVAKFYRSREKPAGVVMRMERAFREYPELAATEDNYLMLAQAYAQTSRIGEAKFMYKAYLQRFPKGEFRDQATTSLGTLKSVDKKSE